MRSRETSDAECGFGLNLLHHNRSSIRSAASRALTR
jgi:hypothetical protein